MNVRVKICGITSVDDVKAAVDAGADAIGFIFVPQSPRWIDPKLAFLLQSMLPPFASSVGVFAAPDWNFIEPIERAARPGFVQIYGNQPIGFFDVFGRFRIIKSLRVASVESIERISELEGAQALLLDGPGGGKTFDWSLVAKARELTTLPIIVAGGLTIDNVADCVRATRPFAVDVASGVESSPGVKDAKLMREFVKRAKAAGADL
jgi:phosphoribosylanthranilate isomerase